MEGFVWDPKKSKDRERLIEEGEGDIVVAFKINGGVLSGKIEMRNSLDKELIVVTKNGNQFKIRYDDVIWVKKGNRWPNAVLKLLKGGSNG